MRNGAGVEELAPASLATLEPLLSRVFLESLGLPVGELLSRDLAEAGAAYLPGIDLFLLARSEGQPSGALLLTHSGAASSPTPLVAWLGVDPRYTRRGLGRSLLAHAVEACRTWGAPAVEARTPATSPAGPRLLWRLGFRTTDLVPVELGGRTREMLLFRLPLRPAPDHA